MIHLLVHHHVKSFKEFDNHASYRKENGSIGGHLFHSLSDPNDVMIFFEWDSVEKAQKFSQSAELREVMQRVGVIGKPDVHILDGGVKFPV